MFFKKEHTKFNYILDLDKTSIMDKGGHVTWKLRLNSTSNLHLLCADTICLLFSHTAVEPHMHDFKNLHRSQQCALPNLSPAVESMQHEHF